MRTTSLTREVSTYATWYEFRKALGEKLGYIPTNSLWLLAKPKAPLPWSDSDMQASFSAVLRLKRQKAA